MGRKGFLFLKLTHIKFFSPRIGFPVNIFQAVIKVIFPEPDGINAMPAPGRWAVSGVNSRYPLPDRKCKAVKLPEEVRFNILFCASHSGSSIKARFALDSGKTFWVINLFNLFAVPFPDQRSVKVQVLLYFLNNILNNLVRGYSASFGFEGQDKPMAEDRVCHVIDILFAYEVPALYKGSGFCSKNETY